MYVCPHELCHQLILKVFIWWFLDSLAFTASGLSVSMREMSTRKWTKEWEKQCYLGFCTKLETFISLFLSVIFLKYGSNMVANFQP